MGTPNHRVIPHVWLSPNTNIGRGRAENCVHYPDGSDRIYSPWNRIGERACRVPSSLTHRYLVQARCSYKINTGHNPLTYFVARRSFRDAWHEDLAPFSYTGEYRAGRNVMADPVSRTPNLSAPPTSRSRTSCWCSLSWSANAVLDRRSYALLRSVPQSLISYPALQRSCPHLRFRSRTRDDADAQCPRRRLPPLSPSWIEFWLETKRTHTSRRAASASVIKFPETGTGSRKPSTVANFMCPT